MISTKRIKTTIFFFFLLITLTALSSGSEVRQFDKEAMQAYADDPQYAYMTYQMQPPSIWDRLMWYLMELWYEFWDNPVTSRLTIWIFILTMLGIAVFFILRMKFRSALEGSTAKLAPDTIINLDDERIDYNGLISEALSQNDFKNAIRWLYLYGLAQLAQKEKVQLAQWKTPYDYQSELTGNSVEPYAKLCLLFEYVWYGEFVVKRADFDKGKNYLEKLEESIE